MDVIIRKLLEPDFPELEKLFNGKKVINELKWLFVNPDNNAEYNAFVAEKDGHIVGVVGYSVTDFMVRGKTKKGIIPMSWMVSPEYRGLAGIQLLKKALNLGEFGFAVTSSETAQKIIPIAKYRYYTSVRVYQKMLRPFPLKTGVLKFLGSCIVATIGAIFGFFTGHKKAISIKATDISGLAPELFNQPNAPEFSDIVTLNKINWLLRCPVVSCTCCFQILNKDKAIGYMVCYISTTKKGIKKGRLIHLSYLGDDKRLWRQAICALESFLRQEKCCVLTVMANNQTFLRSLHGLGFYRTSKSYLVYFDDRLTDMSDSIIKEWNLTFAVSDKGYRGI